MIAGFNTTVFPLTTAAVVIPARIARGKFQGVMTAATPSGMYLNSFLSILRRDNVCLSASSNIII